MQYKYKVFLLLKVSSYDSCPNSSMEHKSNHNFVICQWLIKQKRINDGQHLTFTWQSGKLPKYFLYMKAAEIKTNQLALSQPAKKWKESSVLSDICAIMISVLILSLDYIRATITTLGFAQTH